MSEIIRADNFLSKLSIEQLQSIVDWRNSVSYESLKVLLEAAEIQHLRQLAAKPITEGAMLELSERRGRLLEDRALLNAPEMAKIELQKRNK